MSGKRRWDEKNHQCTWEDLEPWMQSLWEDHGVLVRVEVLMEGIHAGLRPAVRVTGYRVLSGGRQQQVFSDWKVFTLRAIGEVEKHTLQMCSLAQLTLDRDREAAERGYGPLFAQQ